MVTESGKSRRGIGPDWPFAPAKLPFYYGWLLLGFAIVGALASIPGQTIGVSVFTDSLIEATGLSRVALSNCYLAGTVTSGLLLPLGGRALDRFGSRLVAIASSLALGSVLVFLSQADRFGSWSGALFGAEHGGWWMATVLTLGFVALRFSGQGMLMLSSRITVVNWFQKRRALASGIFSFSISAGFSFAPVILALVIDNAGGWREAWLALAVIVGLGMAFLALLFFRDTPESCGLNIDGGPGDDGKENDDEKSFERDEAMKTLVFWTIVIGLSLQSAVITGITFHIVDLGAEAGLTRSQAIGLFPPIAGIGMLVSLFSGVLGDRLRVRTLFLVLVASEAVGYASFAHIDSSPGIALGALGMGISSGLFGLLSTLALPKIFGRTHIAAIASIQMSTMVLGSAVGPSLLAASRSLFGSYAPSLYFAACLPLIVMGVALVAKDPVAGRQNW